MTLTRSASLTIVCLCLVLAGGAAGKQCRNVHLANVKSIFAIAPSPVGADVLFYGSPKKAEGELITGKLLRLRLNGAESDVAQLKAPDASNPPTPVWTSDGSSAYVDTDQGIYQVNTAGRPPELLWKGSAEGMAISQDSLLLAFWRVERGADTLVLYDLKKRSEARTWLVPDRFENDKAGWDLAFAPDGRALYARTYDETSTTPLKRFDIASGEVEAISPDCYAVADAKEAVYFIAVSGTARNLRKIVPTTTSSNVVATEFGYDSLSKGGDPRWLTAQDYRTKEIVVLDTATDTIKSIGKHDSAAVLSDGKLLMISGPDITIGDGSCKPTKRAKGR
jgi:hypothetical protein